MQRLTGERHAREAAVALWSLLHGAATLEAGKTHGENKPAAGIALPASRWVAHELLMAVREAVYNAVLHGEARCITVHASSWGSEIHLRIRDDGKRFDPAAVLDGARAHYGVLGMRERVQTLGGSLRLRSAPGEGTEVQITVRRKRARMPEVGT